MSITPGTHRLRPNRHRDALPPGTSLHTYVVEEIVGQGGFGIVYRARHGALRHRVAIKEYFPLALAVRENGVVSPRGEPCEAPFEDGLQRFREEARLLVEFEEHPNVVSCRDFFSGRGTAYMVMDFEDGKPLSQVLREREAEGRPFREVDLRTVIIPLLKGLESVHSKGVLHRDIKPANILIRRTNHCPVLIDFGAAKHSLAERTRSFAAYTEGYAALEQVGDGRIGPWTDVYGVGAVMWRMVAGGQPPWAPPNPIKVEQRASRLLGGESDPLPATAVLGAGRFSPPLLELVDYCLAVPWEERPQDCSELVGILDGTHKTNKPALHTPEQRSSVSRRQNSMPIPNKHKPTSRLSTKRILIASVTAAFILACATFSNRLYQRIITDNPATAWGAIAETMSEKQLQNFLSRYGHDEDARQWVTLATKRLTQLRLKAEWNRTTRSLDESALRQFIEKYHGNDEAAHWVTLAKQKLSRILEINRAKEAWKQLRETATEVDLSKYIDQYNELPEASAWVREAASKLDQLRRDQIKPSMNDVITGNIRVDWDRIKVISDRDSLQAFLEYYSAEKRNSKWVGIAKKWLALNTIPREVTNSVGMEFVLIPPGHFQMGTVQLIGNRNRHHGPAHEVTISQGFYLGKYEVTQHQWLSVMGQNPSWFDGCIHCPVERVSWIDVSAFIQRLNSMEANVNYRLPTEAEWEYAALGNTNKARYGNLNEIGWYLDNSDGRTHEVGSRVPNQYGLYDLIGNVWEWVQDWHGPYQTALQIDPVGPSRGWRRVTRGCSWVTSPSECLASVRNSHEPSERFGGLGFRLLRHTAQIE